MSKSHKPSVLVQGKLGMEATLVTPNLVQLSVRGVVYELPLLVGEQQQSPTLAWAYPHHKSPPHDGMR